MLVNANYVNSCTLSVKAEKCEWFPLVGFDGTAGGSQEVIKNEVFEIGQIKLKKKCYLNAMALFT